MFEGSKILGFWKTVSPLFKSGTYIDEEHPEAAGIPLGGLRKRLESVNGKKGSPVVVSTPQPQEQQQNQHNHADGHHGDVPLLPMASVAQFPPPQVSVLTSLPDVANDAAMTTHKQKSSETLAKGIG